MTTQTPIYDRYLRYREANPRTVTPTTPTPENHAMNIAGWPEGVIARYLTVAGQALADPTATVDVTHRHTLPPNPKSYATVAVCAGCSASEEFGHYRAYYPSGGFPSDVVEEHEPESADTQARAWAQSHAEMCRAMPK